MVLISHVWVAFSAGDDPTSHTTTRVQTSHIIPDAQRWSFANSVGTHPKRFTKPQPVPKLADLEIHHLI
jgi:hypothetical protein